MSWRDIASIVFICVTVNHLGLIAAIEQTFRHKLPVVNCPKCLAFWTTLAYQLATGCSPLLSLAMSLLFAYLAIWLELAEGFIDIIYTKVYEQIYSTADTHDSDPEHTQHSVSVMRQNGKRCTEKAANRKNN